MRSATFKNERAREMRAFSLAELLVVLVIMGILVLIALPNLMPLISRAKSTEAQQQLVFCTRWNRHISIHIPDIRMI